jgi:hypothetical protein
MNLTLGVLLLTLTIPLGDAPSPTPATLDISVAIHIEHAELIPSPFNPRGIEGFTTPWTIHTVPSQRHRYDALPEELNHWRQYQALGPALPLAYAITLGEPFEPYDLRRGGTITRHDPIHMWEADETRYPTFRVTFERQVDIEFMPGWRP